MYPVAQQDAVEVNTRLNSICRRAQILTRAMGVAIALVHEDAMICRASLGENVPPLGCRLEVASGFSGECVRRGRSLRCDDSEVDPRVDLASCRRLRIRSMLAAPILLEDKIVGLVEVFSAQPFAFDDGDVAILEVLAKNLLQAPAAPKRGTPGISSPEMKPPRVAQFVRQQAPRALSSRSCEPPRFGTVLLAGSPLPWKRFLQSVTVHLLAVGAIAAFPASKGSQPYMVYQDLESSRVVYYRRSERARPSARVVVSKEISKARSGSLLRPVLSVVKERSKRAATSLEPPRTKLTAKLRLLHMLAWTPVTPPVPISATTRTQLMTPGAMVGVVAPPPEVSIASLRAVVAPLQGVVGPPPSLHQSIRHTREIRAGHFEVVGPPPDGAMIESGALSSARDVLRGATSVVPPPPNIGGFDATNQRTSSLSSAHGAVHGAMSVVPPPPNIGGIDGTDQQTSSLSSARGAVHGATSVVPPPPSIGAFDATDQRTAGLLPSNSMLIVPVLPPERAGIGVRGHLDGNAISPDGLSAAKTADRSGSKAVDGKGVSVSPIAPVLPLASSSFFSSSEVFLAEERRGRKESRLIKLVYEFLPYQRRLSDYGPNYSAVENLRVTRDPTCDETLVQLTSTATSASSNPLNLPAHVEQESSAVPCFRTTADDYRRARVRQKR